MYNISLLGEDEEKHIWFVWNLTTSFKCKLGLKLYLLRLIIPKELKLFISSSPSHSLIWTLGYVYDVDL